MGRELGEEFLPKSAEGQELTKKDLPFLRVFLVFQVCVAALMAIVAVASAVDRTNDPRTEAVVKQHLSGTKGCDNLIVAYTTPSGSTHRAKLCSKGGRPPVGGSVAIRYSAEGDDEVHPAEEGVLLMLLIPFGFLTLGVVGLWYVRRRPEALLDKGLRWTTPWS